MNPRESNDVLTYLNFMISMNVSQKTSSRLLTMLATV